MKLLLTKTICLTLLLTFAKPAISQQVNVDSLWQQVITSKTNTAKYRQLTAFVNAMENLSVEKYFVWAKKLLDYGEKTNDLIVKFGGNIMFANVYGGLAEGQKYQEYLIKATIIAESIPDNGNYLAIVNVFRGSGSSDITQRITYYRKAFSLCTDDNYQSFVFMGLANSFLQNSQLDSALTYAQKAYNGKIGVDFLSSSYMTSLFGRIYLKMDQPEIAYGYFKKNLQQAISKNQDYYLLQAYNGMASYFTKVNNEDSVLFYKKKPFEFETQMAYSKKVTSAKWLYTYYLKQHSKDSAMKYLLFYVEGNDSLNNTKKMSEVQQVKIKEELRQRDLEITQQEEKENRNHNIQLAITAIGIISAVILFLLLSRSVLVSHKIVEFLSVIVLLVVFEFINLLIHPWLEKITHHSPILMLLALVAIAALIVPLHHKLEHWTTKKLVEKNKAIRLAKAKKTIEELEKKNTDNNNPTTI